MEFLNNSIDVRKKIIEIVTLEKGRPIPSGIVYRKIQGFCHNKKMVYQEINNLVNENIFQLINERLVLAKKEMKIIPNSEFEGFISINTKGDGFVHKLSADNAEIFVAKFNAKGALNGDKVKCCLIESQFERKLKDGIVLEIIDRNKDFFTGVFNKKQDGSYYVKIDDEKMTIPVVLDNVEGLIDGNKILIKFSNINEKEAYGTVSKVIGYKDSVGVDILSIVYNNGLMPEFDDETINESRKIKIDISDFERERRRDLTNLNIVTIDPKESKDLDDAICVVKENDNYRLYVCIADVAHYVPMDSIIDQTAFKRATSVYLVNQVIPMLPHNLSNDICSLNPNEERLTLTCEVLIDKNGNFVSIDVYPSIINSKKRFSYQEVNDYFTTKKSNDNSIILKMLDDAFDLYKILQKNREIKGYINFDVPEPKIILDANEKIIDIQKKESGNAQMLIENFMVTANEAVTIYFGKKFKHFIYRIHDKPDQRKLDLFKIESKKLNFKISNDIHDIQPNTISKWLIDNKDNPNKDLINIILLRTMAKAKYSTLNIGHFGLSSKNYTHFTSPIRRYPDLIVHRLYWMFLFDKNTNQNDKNKLINNLKNICEQSSKMEMVAVDTERQVNSMKFAEYMENHIGDSFEGFVCYVTSFGVFVQLSNTIEGLARPDSIKGYHFLYDENNSQYIDTSKNKFLTLGTKVKINVLRSNKNERKIDFEITDILK